MNINNNIKDSKDNKGNDKLKTYNKMRKSTENLAKNGLVYGIENGVEGWHSLDNITVERNGKKVLLKAIFVDLFSQLEKANRNIVALKNVIELLNKQIKKLERTGKRNGIY